MSDYVSSPSRPATPVPALPEIPIARPFRLNWDTSSRVRGPASVSETTEGRGGDYYAAPFRLELPNLSTVNIAPGALPQEWSSSTQGFNAISTVLNNPHRHQAPPKAHSSLPAVPPADLPRVKRKDFDPYLRAIGPEWERFERNMQLSRDGQEKPDASFSHRGSTDTPPMPFTPRAGKLLTPLSSVPQVFFDAQFNLGDPHIFNAVIEHQEEDNDSSDPSSLSYSLPLLEKLSHHADTIEQHLVREISLRSTSFFAALTNLQDLQTESEECLDRISKLRGLLKEVDEKGAKRGLEIVRTECKLLNLESICSGVKEIGGVVEMTGVAKGLVAAGQWGEALTVIEGVDALWDPVAAEAPPAISAREARAELVRVPTNGRLSPLPPMPESPPPENEGTRKTPSIPLSSLTAFSSLPAHVRALTMEIASSLTTELVSVLKLDLSERVNGVPERNGNVNLSFKDRLRPVLQGLLRTKGIREATVSWREVVTSEMQGIVKHHLPSFNMGDEESKGPKAASSGLANLLRSKEHAEFLLLLSQLYTSLLNGIKGIQAQNGILIEVLESLLAPKPSVDIISLQEELLDILSSTADLSNKLAAIVIGYRSEQHAQLDLPGFLTFFNASWGFVVQCEVICRRMIMGLRGVVLGQAKHFLQAFHQARISQSAKLVEDELWNPMSDVPAALQHMADVLVDSAVRDSPELIVGETDSSTSAPNPLPPQSASSNPNGSAPSSKYLRIEERPYFCVSATGAVLGLLFDYLKLVVNLPMLNIDTMGRVIEFLKAFNSRTCQVVLGAGAMRSAGLKNITAKHLALASQSLSIMVALIPYVRETFRRHLSPTQAVMLIEFDKLKRDFQEHQSEIHSKLISIMGDRTSAHVKSLQNVDWDRPKQGESVNDYMELLVKETVTLHKVLSRYLTAPVVEYVMSQVFAAINHRLSEEYSKIDLQNQEAKDRMLADAHYLHEKFSVLKSVGAPTNVLKNVVAEKPLPRKSAFSNIRATASPNERIKGLLSRKNSVKPDKPLPAVNSSPTPSPPPPPPQEAPTHAATVEEDRSGSSTPDIVVPPSRGSSRARGIIDFKQMESSSRDVDAAEKDELPPIPDDANHSLLSEADISNGVASEMENNSASAASYRKEEREISDNHDEVPPAVPILPCNGDS
ncbi:Vps54-like protein-domain-containing protein [Suillus fuscotomentosus]|uniref:Vps54-like protein-domain-containing protein n=1 Tax=Suillus fuscotomentosus TaxID=1912939 RepID=A0AAD4HP93_9AGAM|nr:Vps54-like protein-domain-containing protein [Suillus fuscotomentosus]KAG1903777.1 Vps54-like protein-domain-containing protein [Suillus fuscotomentosus]